MATKPQNAKKSSATKPLTCHTLWVTRGASADFAKLDAPTNAQNRQLWAANESGYLMLSPEGEAAYAANLPATKPATETATSTKSGKKGTPAEQLKVLLAAGVALDDAMEAVGIA